VMSTPHESFRGQLATRTPDGDPTRVIVTSQSGHRARRMRLTLYGSWRGTVCLADLEVEELAALLHRAKWARL